MHEPRPGVNENSSRHDLYTMILLAIEKKADIKGRATCDGCIFVQKLKKRALFLISEI